MKEKISVSICCSTYNHENYIADALESFLKQKTDFNFEILIHDDASSDKTAEIIREYEMKYPNIIKPIYQTENQYSKGIKIGVLNRERAKGKYIAICEGDDYWIDENKLQKQFNYMTSNPSCTFCFHNAYLLDYKKSNLERLVIPWLSENKNFLKRKSKKYSAGELQLLGYIPTASFFFPRELLTQPPSWILSAPAGDNALKLLASSYGYAYYMEEPMSIYRFNIPQSATTKWKTETKEDRIERANKFIKMLEEFDYFTNSKYSKEIEMSKVPWELQILRAKNIRNNLMEQNFKKYTSHLSKVNKIKHFILSFLCKEVNLAIKIKNCFY